MQDFSKKMTIIIREDVSSWRLMNVVGHIAAYLGNKMTEPFDTGEYFTSKEGLKLPRNSQYAIVALQATKDELKVLAARLSATGLSWIVYVQEMIDMADDGELEQALKAVSSKDMDILGIGMFGSKDKMKELTGSLRLWK